ncbi:MAG: NADH-quinone oxidoreductase subunit NuoE [Planctomycetota bacterium]
MAWITKNSSTATPSRDAAHEGDYLTEAMRADLRDRYLPRFETTHAALLPALHMIQHHYGWVPERAMLEIARFLDLPPAEVIDTATFYEEYWLRPKGAHVIAVCRSIACEFCGQPEISEACKVTLGVDVGETTDDGSFTLIELECLGSCGTAPVALIDETLHENLTPEQVPGLIDQARANSGHPGGH